MTDQAAIDVATDDLEGPPFACPNCGVTDRWVADANGILEDVPVDALIAYKDALEDLVGRLAQEPA